MNLYPYRLALQTGLLLLVCGIGIYLPIQGVAGRYTMPAAWGADLWLAALLSALVSVPLLFWRRLALGLLLGGLLGIVLINLGRQDKVQAHNALLWQALEYLEQEVPPTATVIWLQAPDGVSPPGLPYPDGVHFRAHLQGRKRSAIDLQPVWWNEYQELPGLILSSGPLHSVQGDYRLVREFHTRYWAGHKSYQCFLWERCSSRNSPTRLHAGR